MNICHSYAKEIDNVAGASNTQPKTNHLKNYGRTIMKYMYEPFNMTKRENTIETIISAIFDTVAILAVFVILYFVFIFAAAATGGI